jgi:hypothetical protein
MSRTTEKSLALVIGAGASKEVNLPVGSELKQQIARVLNIRYEHGHQRVGGDEVIDAAFRRLAASINPNRPDINPYLEAAWRVRDAMPQAISIDNFIDSHRSDEKIAICGKLAIARCILDAESKSSLKVDHRNFYNKVNFSAVEQTWFNAFFQLLTENCQQKELPERLSKVGIICFNYDRCIEHYLHSALQNYYGMSPEDASAALSNLEIHHPYGTIGKLPWQSPRDGFEYGATPQSTQLVTLAGDLRTFTEGIDTEKSDIGAIRSILGSARRIAFLGFAFHRLNIQLLFPGLADGEKVRACPVYATGYGISSADVQEIKQELSGLAGIHHEHIYIRSDLQSAQLFREFWRSLSLQ